MGQSSLERSGSLDKLASPPATPNTQVVLKVAMACGGCSGAVERVLAKMEGEVAQGQKALGICLGVEAGGKRWYCWQWLDVKALHTKRGAWPGPTLTTL